MEFVHANIGPTGPWGKPIFPAFPRPWTWQRYPTAPWYALGPDYRADVILVDGRFRVACSLAVVYFQADSEWTMMVDDFEERSHYEPICKFAAFEGMHGRMAKFVRDPEVDPGAAKEALRKFVEDWR